MAITASNAPTSYAAACAHSSAVLPRGGGVVPCDQCGNIGSAGGRRAALRDAFSALGADEVFERGQTTQPHEVRLRVHHEVGAPLPQRLVE